MDITTLQQSVSQVIGAIVHRKDEATKAAGEGKKAVELLRNLAKQVSTDGLNSEAVAEFMANQMKLANIPAGTIKPYRVAFRGYCEAAKSGVDVDKYKDDAKGVKRPMTAPEAREYLTLANETPAEKEVREASERLAKLRAAIMQRVNAVKDAPTLQAILDSDILPALPDGVTEGETQQQNGAETRQARERREAEEAAAKALAAAFAKADTDADAGEAHAAEA